MTLIPAKCSQCGADLQIDNTRDVFFCNYCGAKMIVEKQYVEHSGTISLSGIASEDSLTERAFMFIEDGEFSKADEYFERVLDANPKSWKAYLGKLLCSLNLKSANKLGLSYTPLTNNALYNKAVEFAPENEKEQLIAYNNAILNRLSKQKAEKDKKILNMQDELNRLTDKANVLDDYLRRNTAKHVASSTTGMVLGAGMVGCWGFALFLVLGIFYFFSKGDFSGVITFLIISLIFVSIGTVCFFLRRKLGSFTKEFNKNKKELDETINTMTKIDNDLKKQG